MSIDRRFCLAGLSALAMGGSLSRGVAQSASIGVLAAISLKGVLGKLSTQWAADASQAPLRIAYGASNALARQIELGAPGDCFLSADLDWMAYLAQRGLLRADTQREFAANRLVIIALAGKSGMLDLGSPASIRAALGSERLAVARTDLVPAGRYAREALQSLGIWEKIKPSLVETEHPLAALQLVARGEARFGIVYRSDALGDARVSVVAEIPTTSHRPIRYPAAVLQSSTHPQARQFLDWLASEAARKTLRDAGFGLPEATR